LVDVLNEDNFTISSPSLKNFLQKHRKELDADQHRVVFELAMMQAKKNAMKNVAKTVGQRKKTEEKTEKDKSTKDYFSTKKTTRVLTEEEKENIGKKYNVTIENNIKGLMPEVTSNEKSKKGYAQREAALAEIKSLLSQEDKQVDNERTEIINDNIQILQEEEYEIETLEEDQDSRRGELTEEERNEVEEFNNQVKEFFPELEEQNLLEADPVSGQYESPTPEWIKEKYDEVTSRLEDIAEYDNFGNLVNPSEEIIDLEIQKNTLEKYLRSFNEFESIPWGERLPSEKWETIASELMAGETIEGTLQVNSSARNNRSFFVKLSDGRILKAYAPQGKETTVKKKSANNEQVKLEYQTWNKWNEDAQKKDRQGRPYSDRVIVKQGNQIIGSLEITNFAQENRRVEEYQEIRNRLKKATAEMSSNLSDMIADALRSRSLAVEDPNLKKEFRKNLFEAIDAIGDMVWIKIEDFINMLKQQIRESSGILDEHKKVLLSMVDRNRDTILNYVISKRAELQNIKMKNKARFSEEDLVIDENENVVLTGHQKILGHLKTYGKLWKSIADATETSKEKVEKTFFHFIKNADISIAGNESGYHQFLLESKSMDPLLNQILDTLQELDFNKAISMFDFYKSLYIAKHYGYVLTKSGLKRKLLNAPFKLEDFRQSYQNTITKLSYSRETSDGKTITYEGYEAAIEMINDHAEKTFRRQQGIMNLPEQERIALKRKQHEEDVELLSAITGIPENLWNEYFTEQTRETYAYPNKEGKDLTNFRTFENILTKDVYNRKGWPKIQSQIAFSLLMLTKKSYTRKEFKDALDAFFLEGSEKNNTFSNLYKLATASTSQEDLALFGFDIKYDRFSSFVQSSDFSVAAENILNDERNNPIIEYYKKKGVPMEIIMLSGMQDVSNNGNPREASKMSIPDIWVANLSFFLNEEGGYNQLIGQEISHLFLM